MLNTYLSEYILSDYHLKIETINDETLQSIYQEFTFRYFNLIIDDVNIKDQKIDHYFELSIRNNDPSANFTLTLFLR